MKEIKEVSPYDVLEIFYNEMVKTGNNHQCIYASIDDIISDIPNSNKELIEPIVKKCIADGWLKYFSGNSYQLTDQGKGVIISLNKKREIETQKKLSQKISDFFQEKSGIFIPLNFSVTLLALIVAIYAAMKN